MGDFESPIPLKLGELGLRRKPFGLISGRKLSRTGQFIRQFSNTLFTKVSPIIVSEVDDQVNVDQMDHVLYDVNVIQLDYVHLFRLSKILCRTIF
nr:MAG: hypothetical protein EDM05_05720 [Leptolyngbya sp. IPPAS B-1204]